MSSRNDDEEEEKPREINWAIWLPIVVITIGAAIWFFLFVILDLGGVKGLVTDAIGPIRLFGLFSFFALSAEKTSKET